MWLCLWIDTHSKIASFCQAICLSTEPDLANSKFSIYSSITNWLHQLYGEESFWRSCHAVIQEAAHMELTVYYYDHKTPPLEPNLSYVNSVHIFISHFCKIHFNIIFPFMPIYAQVFSGENPYWDVVLGGADLCCCDGFWTYCTLVQSEGRFVFLQRAVIHLPDHSTMSQTHKDWNNTAHNFLPSASVSHRQSFPRLSIKVSKHSPPSVMLL